VTIVWASSSSSPAKPVFKESMKRSNGTRTYQIAQQVLEAQLRSSNMAKACIVLACRRKARKKQRKCSKFPLKSWETAAVVPSSNITDTGKSNDITRTSSSISGLKSKNGCDHSWPWKKELEVRSSLQNETTTWTVLIHFNNSLLLIDARTFIAVSIGRGYHTKSGWHSCSETLISKPRPISPTNRQPLCSLSVCSLWYCCLCYQNDGSKWRSY
jgi:hypothetical protein